MMTPSLKYACIVSLDLEDFLQFLTNRATDTLKYRASLPTTPATAATLACSDARFILVNGMRPLSPSSACPA